MTKTIFSRRAVLGGLLASVGGSALAGAPERSLFPVARSGAVGLVSVPEANGLIRRAALGGKIGYVVADAATGEVLEAINPVLALPPASVAKVITAQYALETLGSGHRFDTRLVALGPVTNGRLDGDLVLLGGGDPTLNTTALAEMAASLKDAGIREVSGRFLVHSGELPHLHQIDSGQPDHLSYNPAVSGLNLNFNRVHFEWKKAAKGYSITMDARTAKYRPEVALTRMKVVDRKSPIYTYANGGRTERWTVAKHALGTKGSRWLPVRQPELYAGEVLQILARSHGIVLRRPELARKRVEGVVLVSRQSQQLHQILKRMLSHSTNLTAEVSGLSASIARGSPVSGLGASGAQMSSWMQDRYGARRPRFVDHSGLGDKSRISASDMVIAMVGMGADGPLANMLKPIHLRDDKGKPRLGPGVELRAKTGTLNFVSALSGFITNNEGRDLVFAIFSADMPRRRAVAPANRERPEGARNWSRRARSLQWKLIERWVAEYG